MRKRVLTVLLSVVLLLGLFGCSNIQEETIGAAEPIEDVYPEMEYGVWETDVLKSEPGNYDRSARVSNGSWGETAKGYYRINNSILYFADKSNPSNWVPLCSEPDCLHVNCSANVGYCICFANDRIYYLMESRSRPELYQGNKNGVILCSMAMDGTDVKLEFAWEEAMLDQSGNVTAHLSPTGLLIGKQQLNADGVWVNQLFLANDDGARCIYEQTSENNVIHCAWFSYINLCVGGQNAICTSYIDCGSDYLSTIHWVKDESIQSADLSNLPYLSAFFFDGNLRFFRVNDGFYDVNLSTMEEVKLCDAQLENSGVRFLQANCILESNLIKQNSETPDGTGFSLPRVGEGALRLFNGQQWLDVELPEELRNLPDGTYLSVTTLTGEYVICTAKIDGAQRYYRIDLAAENLKLEYWFELS